MKRKAANPEHVREINEQSVTEGHISTREIDKESVKKADKPYIACKKDK